MKFTNLIFLQVLVLLTFSNCKNVDKNSYAISDFRKSLQPHLTEIAAKGIVYYYDSSLRNMASDKELLQLSKAENPLLRAAAFREILHRPTFNHFDILMAHLNDTAKVTTDEGEFGTGFKYISDYLIENSKWKDSLERDVTIDTVLKNYNYLSCAYSILDRIPPQEKYYQAAKQMLTYDKPFRQLEHALLYIAKFKKDKDFVFIKDIFMNNIGFLSTESFQLIQEYPNDIYLEVLHKYSEKAFFRNICLDNKTEDAISCFSAIASYKQTRSAEIIKTVLTKLSNQECIPNPSYLKDEFYNSIWANQCEAYSEFLKIIKPIKIEYEKKYGNENVYLPISIDTISKKQINWFN